MPDGSGIGLRQSAHGEGQTAALPYRLLLPHRAACRRGISARARHRRADCSWRRIPCHGVRSEADDLRDITDAEALGPSTAAVIDAAKQRNIPAIRLADGTSLFQLGWGAR